MRLAKIMVPLAALIAPTLAWTADVLAPDKVAAFLQGPGKAVMTSASIINAIKAQNERNKNLDQAKIDALDNEWKTEFKAAGTGKTISAVVDNEVSDELRKFKETNGEVIREVFVMDNKGMNVAAAEPTSDYWQGDEDKWIKTYATGPDAVFADKVKFDESSGQSQAQVSATIKDPASGQAIGAVTFGVNVGALK